MRRPFLIPVVVMCGGIVVADRVGLPLLFMYVVAFGLAGACILHEKRRSRWLWLFLFLFGWVNFATRTAVVSPNDLRTILGDTHELVELRGTLVGRPRKLIAERDGVEFRHSLAILRPVEITRGKESIFAHGLVAAHTPDWLDGGGYAGREVSVVGVIGPPPPPLAEGLFDYQKHLYRRGIYFSVDVESPSDWRFLEKVGGPARRPLSDRFRDWAQAVLSRGLPKDDPTVRLLWAISLGWKAGLTDEVATPFMRSGAIHLFAVSGLHVAMISGIVVSLLRALFVPRAWCGAVAIPALWFFCAVTGFHSSAVRATIMMSIVIAGWSLERPVDVLNSLAGAAFLILVWEPRQLFHAGFQLSFVVVCGIALMAPRFELWREALLKTDPLLPLELRPRWRRLLDGPSRWLFLGVATSLAAWLGSAPLIATYFNLFTPVSLLANLLIVPLAGPTLAACLASLACGDVFPSVGELFNHCAWFAMTLMCGLSEWFSNFPGAWRNVASPSPIAIGLYYLLLTGVLNRRLFHRPRAKAWAAAGGVVLSCLLVSALAPSGWTQITVLALRGGGSVFVDAPGRSGDLLVDCGDPGGARSVVAPFLKSKGHNGLATVALTHGDVLHVGGYEHIACEFPISDLLFNPVPSRSPVYRRVVDELPDFAHPVLSGDSLGIWKALHPKPDDRFASGDDNALVLLGEVHGLRVLLLSDLGGEGQRMLFERHPDLKADIVMAALPGRGTPLKNGLLSALEPSLIIVADAPGQTVGRADPELRARLREHKARVLYTSDVGSVTVKISRSGWNVRTMRGSETAPSG